MCTELALFELSWPLVLEDLLISKDILCILNYKGQEQKHHYNFFL